jgi:hypothetical protein
MVDHYVGLGDFFSPAAVAEEFITTNPTLVSAEADRLIYAKTVDQVKVILRKREGDNAATGQLSIPGITLPSVVAVPAEVPGGHLYKRTLDCTWADLEGAREVRRRNRDDVVAAYDLFDASVESLREHMSEDRRVTMREAMLRIHQKAA